MYYAASADARSCPLKQNQNQNRFVAINAVRRRRRLRLILSIIMKGFKSHHTCCDDAQNSVSKLWIISKDSTLLLIDLMIFDLKLL